MYLEMVVTSKRY